MLDCCLEALRNPHLQAHSGFWKNSVSCGWRTEVPIDFLSQIGMLLASSCKLTPSTCKVSNGTSFKLVLSNQEEPRLQVLNRSYLMRIFPLSQCPLAKTLMSTWFLTAALSSSVSDWINLMILRLSQNAASHSSEKHHKRCFKNTIPHQKKKKKDEL